MKPLKDGRFKVMLELEPERDYEYRYLVDGQEWHNDWEAELLRAQCSRQR